MKEPEPRARVVYESGRGRICPGCGWPADDCRCSKNLAHGGGVEAVPEKPTAKLRVESRASGRHVTVVGGLPRNPEWLDALCKELKKACGAGGSATEDSVEIQGDHRERLRELLARKGMTVKG
jgi:translation initiation factor 1